MTVLALSGVGLRRDGVALLSDVDWTVERGQHWVLLGANGSGKTSLVRLAGLYEHPTEGAVEVLGERLGRTDVRSLRRRVAMVSPAMADLLRPASTAADIVMCAKHAALEPWWHEYDAADRERSRDLLARHGVAHAADRPFASLSSGERQRVLLARSLMTDPDLVLLDEPSAGLDLGAREELVAHLDELASAPDSATMVLVTHHVEEIPPSFTHLLALRAGTVAGRGPLRSTLDATLLGHTFGVDVVLEHHDDGRISARGRGRAGSPR